MRRWTIGALAALAIGSGSTVRAADLDYGVLRGAEYEPAAPLIDWSGFYIGGHGGYSSAALGFKNVFQPIVANALRSTIIETDLSASTLLSAHSVRVDGASYGAFAGYNVQLDDTVIGFEVDYTRFDLAGTSSDVISRYKITSDNYLTTVALSGDATTNVIDYGTLRGRAGYALGNFLPFVTGGLAIGRAKISDTVGVQGYAYDQNAYTANQAAGATPVYINHYGYQTFIQSNPPGSIPAAPVYYGTTKTKTVAGVALGAGIEYAITSSILLRGEYQYVLFNDFDGHKVNMNTVRGGAALKF